MILGHHWLVLNGPILDKAFTSGPKRGNGIPVAYSLSQDANAVFGLSDRVKLQKKKFFYYYYNKLGWEIWIQILPNQKIVFELLALVQRINEELLMQRYQHGDQQLD